MNLNINIAHSDIKDQSDRLIDNVNMYDELLRMTTAPMVVSEVYQNYSSE